MTEFDERLGLSCGSGNVELKCSVELDCESPVEVLGMDLLAAERCQVVFFDRPDLDVSDHGVTVRVRRVAARSADSVVALRGVDPDGVATATRNSRGFGFQLEATPGGLVCAAAIRAKLDPTRVRETLSGRWPLDRLFTRQQRELFEAHGPNGASLGGLERLGPMHGLRLKGRPPGFGRRLVAEGWHHPDGTRILELSTRCPPAEAYHVAAEIGAFLAERDMHVSIVHQTKTRAAMHYFASELQAAARCNRIVTVSP